MQDYLSISAALILLFPALGALTNAFFGRRLGRRAAAIIANLAVAAAFVMAVLIFAGLFMRPVEERSLEVLFWQWIHIGDLRLDFALLLDPLSSIMALVVTGVGLVIHLYAAGYMKLDDEHQPLDERRYARFFTYVNLFILLMLVLVLANNYVLLYLGWEGVGLASYLLISFWFHRPAAADAGKKAFIVNRIGDFGLALAVFWLFSLFGKQAGSLAFTGIFAQTATISALNAPVFVGITLLLLLAATGKSAQIPLFVWLPDAMEGPTPVSALIHAATMVTAGVYMIARSHPLFQLAPTTMEIVAWIGALTAFFAATIAIVQTDLKRILAYSTISQLGYMFLAVGVGAYASGIFHLMTHAFFKALLFLAAGSVMHALHGHLNIDEMGGLKAKLPRTYLQFLIGALALAGFPLLAGFWSKDAILFSAFEHSMPLYLIGLATALMTAFYSFRAVYRAFHGQPRNQHLYEHAHEQPRGMTGPLWILAAGSLVAGFLGLPAALGLPNLFTAWLEPVFATLPHTEHGEASLELLLLGLSGLIAILGIFLAYLRYIRQSRWTLAVQRGLRPLQPVLEHKYWIDEIYMAVIVRPLRAFAQLCFRFFDQTVIDGAVNGLGRATAMVGAGAARLQTGLISWYAISLVIGVVALLGYFFLFR
ncbi:MAG: NADH-quinone oxidoreductase subunit L [Caldilineales bacterium]|nr:NADH-quinone oxidoreductase subunit L [Caldilineales bacterium]MCW5856859.1 NADH-quinone oxidoreductase subunit L [Caldilineales bacterium]